MFYRVSRIVLSLAPLVATVGCSEDPPSDDVPDLRDRDGDGVPDARDCAPDDPLAGGPEVCDGYDNDCDGAVDNIAGLFPSEDSVASEVASARLHGLYEADLAGRHLIMPGDVNGDGFDDLLLKSEIVSGVSPEGRSSMVYLVHGPLCGDLSLSLQPEGVSFATVPGLAALHALGDVNGDGFADFGLNNYILFGPIGGPALFSDAAATLSLENSAGYSARAPMIHGPDFNGDGVADLLYSEPFAPRVYLPEEDLWGFGPGRVSIFFGPIGPGTLDLENADASIEGVLPLRGFGWAVTSPGDINGDGVDDLLVGAKEGSTVFKFLSPFAGTRYAPDDAEGLVEHTDSESHFGVNLLSLDSDEMGVDFLVGTIGAGAWGFRAELGEQDESNAELFVPNHYYNGFSFGSVLAKGADFNGNQEEQVVVLTRDVPGSFPAALLLSPGSSVTLSGAPYGLMTVAEAGDFNGDGLPDLALGEAGPSLDGAELAGRILIIYGTRGPAAP